MIWILFCFIFALIDSAFSESLMLRYTVLNSSRTPFNEESSVKIYYTDYTKKGKPKVEVDVTTERETAKTPTAAPLETSVLKFSESVALTISHKSKLFRRDQKLDSIKILHPEYGVFEEKFVWSEIEHIDWLRRKGIRDEGAYEIGDFEDIASAADTLARRGVLTIDLKCELDIPKFYSNNWIGDNQIKIQLYNEWEKKFKGTATIVIYDKNWCYKKGKHFKKGKIS